MHGEAVGLSGTAPQEARKDAGPGVEVRRDMRGRCEMNAPVLMFPGSRAVPQVLPQVWATATGTSDSAPLYVEIEPAIPELELLQQGAQPVEMTEPVIPQEAPPPEMAFYRKYTEALLRRYLRMSMASGRVPSLVGRELFRGRVSNYKVSGFDDVVIFVHDVEKCLAKLSRRQRALIDRIALQEYTQGEVASRLKMCVRTVQRLYGEALDELTEMFLARNLLEPQKACQEAGNLLSAATACGAST
jgi:hypothetical protein